MTNEFVIFVGLVGLVGCSGGLMEVDQNDPAASGGFAGEIAQLGGATSATPAYGGAVGFQNVPKDAAGGATMTLPQSVSGTGPVAMADAIAGACAQPRAGLETITSQRQFDAFIAGDWYLCNDVAPFGTADEMGLRINTDGSWSTLHDDPADSIVPVATGGTWESIDTRIMNGSGHFQLNLSTNGSTRMFLPKIHAGGQMMRLQNEMASVPENTYVKATSLMSQ